MPIIPLSICYFSKIKKVKKSVFKSLEKVVLPVVVALHYFAKFDLDFVDESFDLQHYLGNVDHPMVQLELNYHLVNS